jgi:hypothetical protein
MQAVHEKTGMVMDFPDGTPDWEIQQQFQQAEMSMPTPQVSLAQQFMNGIQGQFQQQQAAPAPINGRGMIGLNPQQAQFMLQQRQNDQAMRQQSAIEEQRNRLREQAMLQQSLESEKDRSLRIKEFQSRLKNEQAMAKAEQDYIKWKAEQDVLGKEQKFAWDKELEILRQQGRQDLQAQRIKGQEQIAQIRAAGRGGGGGGATSSPRVYNTNSRPYIIEDGQIVYLEGYEPEEGGGGRGTGEMSARDKITIMQESRREAEETYDDAKEAAEAAGQTLTRQEHLLETKRRLRRAAGFSAFEDKKEAASFENQIASKWYPKLVESGKEPEKARELAQELGKVERWRKDGYQAKLDVNGKAIVLKPDGEDTP